MPIVSSMISVNKVCKRFGANEVLHNVSFEVNRGEVVCLIGASGSGKSTMLRCMNGLEVYDEGAIHFGAERVDARDGNIAAIRQKVSMVFQDFNLFPHRSVIENVMEGLVYVKKTKKEAAYDIAFEALKHVGLEDKVDTYPSTLSGGQKQRVAIARAIAMEPQAILFDEPTSALDPELVGDVLEVMRMLAAEGMTMVVVTHEIQFAQEIASRVLFLHNGNILEQGDPQSVLGNPKEPRTQEFLKRVIHR